VRDTRSLKPLIARLRDADSAVRWKACEALGQLGEARAARPLIAALKDEDYLVREKACEALGKLGGRRAIKALARMTWDEDNSVARAACVGLGESGDVRAVKPLRRVREADTRTWGHYSGLVKGAAEDALRKLGENGVFEAMVALLEDEDSNTAYAGSQLLAASRDPRARWPLKRKMRKLERRRQTDGLEYSNAKEALQQLVADLGLSQEPAEEKEPPRRALTASDFSVGTYFVASGGMGSIIGKCTGKMDDQRIMALCFSSACRQGEEGTFPINRIRRIVSEEEFNREFSYL